MVSYSSLVLLLKMRPDVKFNKHREEEIASPEVWLKYGMQWVEMQWVERQASCSTGIKLITLLPANKWFHSTGSDESLYTGSLRVDLIQFQFHLQTNCKLSVRRWQTPAPVERESTRGAGQLSPLARDSLITNKQLGVRGMLLWPCCIHGTCSPFCSHFCSPFDIMSYDWSGISKMICMISWYVYLHIIIWFFLVGSGFQSSQAVSLISDYYCSVLGYRSFQHAGTVGGSQHAMQTRDFIL